MNAIICIEGPNAVGKSIFARRLARRCMMDQYEMYHHCNATSIAKEWSRPYDAVIEYLSLYNLWQSDVRIVLDRGLVSWCMYNSVEDQSIEFISEMVALMRKWDYAKIVYMFGSTGEIMRRSAGRGEVLAPSEVDNELREYELLMKNIPSEFIKYVNVDQMDDTYAIDDICECLFRGIGD